LFYYHEKPHHQLEYRTLLPVLARRITPLARPTATPTGQRVPMLLSDFFLAVPKSWLASPTAKAARAPYLQLWLALSAWLAAA
jgi:hypothetical protein